MLASLGATPGLETLVVELDDRPSLDAGQLPPGTRVLFERDAGPFNKSRGFNAGFRESSADIIVFADADLLVPAPLLQAAFAACRHGTEFVRPWAHVVDLSEEETQALTGGALRLEDIATHERRGRQRAGEFPPLCGGLYVIRREVYARLGGQDERFRGWGGEDDAMSIKVGKLCTRVGMGRDGVAFHLYHPRHASLPLQDPSYLRNLEILREYAAAAQLELEQLCALHWASLNGGSRLDLG